MLPTEFAVYEIEERETDEREEKERAEAVGEWVGRGMFAGSTFASLARMALASCGGEKG